MSFNREKLLRFPWSMTDNPGGWVEVTDECDISCPGWASPQNLIC